MANTSAKDPKLVLALEGLGLPDDVKNKILADDKLFQIYGAFNAAGFDPGLQKFILKNNKYLSFYSALQKKGLLVDPDKFKDITKIAETAYKAFQIIKPGGGGSKAPRAPKVIGPAAQIAFTNASGKLTFASLEDGLDVKIDGLFNVNDSNAFKRLMIDFNQNVLGEAVADGIITATEYSKLNATLAAPPTASQMFNKYVFDTNGQAANVGHIARALGGNAWNGVKGFHDRMMADDEKRTLYIYGMTGFAALAAFQAPKFLNWIKTNGLKALTVAALVLGGLIVAKRASGWADKKHGTTTSPEDKILNLTAKEVKEMVEKAGLTATDKEIEHGMTLAAKVCAADGNWKIKGQGIDFSAMQSKTGGLFTPNKMSNDVGSWLGDFCKTNPSTTGAGVAQNELAL